MNIFALHDHDDDLKKRGCFHISRKQAAELNEQGYGIFWTPNSFAENKRSKDNLLNLNFWYIDMDKGTKDSMVEKMLAFPLPPTLVIETHGGFHVYWKCEPHLVVDGMLSEYLDILDGLIQHFEADERAGGETRILRVPGFYHCKDPMNKFLVTEIWRKDMSYTCEQMREAIKQDSERLVKKIEKKRVFQKTEFFSMVPQDDFWQKVFDLDCEKYLPMLSGAPECNGEHFRVERYGSKSKIFTDGELVQSCWIDHDGKIGSHSNGGPSLANWIAWYGNKWDIVAKCLKRQIPSLNETVQIGTDFEW